MTAFNGPRRMGDGEEPIDRARFYFARSRAEPPGSKPGLAGEIIMFSIESIQFTETGRRLGHDLFQYRSPIPIDDLPPSVREGFRHASSSGTRPRSPDRFIKKWLQLRVSAWHRRRAFDESVTPELLRSMDVAVCPVMRISLTHGELSGSDWSVDRINNDGAYAANNLAVISTLANRAKGSLTFEEVLLRSRRPSPSEGLAPGEWLRMAALMLGPCFATRPSEAPALPLAAPIAPFSLRLALQQVQHVFTLRSATQSGKNLLIKHFRSVSPTERAESRLRMLAERVHLGLKREACPYDVWLQEPVMPALMRWRECLDDTGWARAGEVSRCFATSRVVPKERLQRWALATRGYVN